MTEVANEVKVAYDGNLRDNIKYMKLKTRIDSVLNSISMHVVDEYNMHDGSDINVELDNLVRILKHLEKCDASLALRLP